MSNQTAPTVMKLSNPGIGDASFIHRDKALRDGLKKFSDSSYELTVVKPKQIQICGGYNYILHIHSQAEEIKGFIKELKITVVDKFRDEDVETDSEKEPVVDKFIYEGAGFLLYHANKETGECHLILGERQKKPEDVAKDPTKELEYQGGKPEKKRDGTPETPYQTAECELIEEVGGVVLETNWESRAKPMWTFQPISKKWIWCFLLEVNDSEYRRLMVQDAALTAWDPTEKRDLSQLTRRNELSRKSLNGLYLVSIADVLGYIGGFAAVPATANRMKDAKEYGKVAKKFTAWRMTDVTQTLDYPLRGFNLVIFEQHVNTIRDYMNDTF